MRKPEFDIDGWCLEDGEAYHAEAPDTFWIPERHRRESLEAGDHAKLIFRISVDDADENFSIERMWVLVRERTSNGFLGVLANESNAIAENDDFWLGTELPFSANHVINIQERDASTIAAALDQPRFNSLIVRVIPNRLALDSALEHPCSRQP